MTAIEGAFSFNKSMFSDPSMRPHLQEYYEDSYAAIRERVAAMKEAEASGQTPHTIQTKEGKAGVEFTAAQYESMIPGFDKWMEMQKNFSAFDAAKQGTSWVENAQEALGRVEKDHNPDQPSGVQAVFSSGDRILGYINDDGGVVTHAGGAALQKIAEQADALNLNGAEKIAYIQERGAAELSQRYGDLHMQTYTSTTMPTRREFAEKWYPDHDVDAAYNNVVQELKASLEKWKSLQDQQMKNLDQMRNALLEIMQDAQAA